MIPPRAIQNFRNFRGLWWGSPCAASEALASAMGRLGATFDIMDEELVGDLAAGRDIVFIDGDGVFDPAKLCTPGRAEPLVPVIGVVGIEAPSRLKALTDAGATALLRKPIHPSTVYSALFLAANNHARFVRMTQRIAEQDRRHGNRRYVIKAVVKLMREQGLCDEQAFAQLRRDSMRLRIGIEEFARTLCSSTYQPEETLDDAHQEDLARDSRDDDRGDDRADSRAGGRSDQTRRA